MKKFIFWISLVWDRLKWNISDDESGIIYNDDGYPVAWSEVAYRARLFTCLFQLPGMASRLFLCTYKGHAWDVDSYCGPESGSEHFYCERCGISQHIHYY